MNQYDNDWLTAQGHGERIGAQKGLQAGINHGHSEGYDQGWSECANAAMVQYNRLVEKLKAVEEHAQHLESLLADAHDVNADLRTGYSSALKAQNDWKGAYYSLLTVAEPAMDLIADQAELRNKLVFAAIKKNKFLESKGIENDLVSDNQIIKKTSPKVVNSFGNWFGRLLAIANRSEKTPNMPRAS